MSNCIEEKRKALGMTRAVFAQKMQVDYTTAWRWEHGEMLPDPSRMRQLSTVLHTPLPELFPDLFGPSANENDLALHDAHMSSGAVSALADALTPPEEA